MLDTLQIHNVYTHSGYLNYKTGKLAQNLGVTIMYQSYATIACAIIASPDSVSPSSLIYNYSVWGQSSECENPVTLSLSSWLRCYCCGSLQFLPLPGLYRVVWLAEVGFSVFTLFSVLMLDWSLFIPICRAFSVSPTFCRPQFLHGIR